MQYRDININPKPLENLRHKYHVSNSRLYQIWRGREFRIEWNQPISNSAFSSRQCIISSDINSNAQSTLSAVRSKDQTEKDVINLKSTNLPRGT